VVALGHVAVLQEVGHGMQGGGLGGWGWGDGRGRQGTRGLLLIQGGIDGSIQIADEARALDFEGVGV